MGRPPWNLESLLSMLDDLEDSTRQMQTALRGALQEKQQAVAAERERCAQAVEDARDYTSKDFRLFLSELAAHIRIGKLPR